MNIDSNGDHPTETLDASSSRMQFLKYGDPNINPQYSNPYFGDLPKKVPLI